MGYHLSSNRIAYALLLTLAYYSGEPLALSASQSNTSGSISKGHFARDDSSRTSPITIKVLLEEFDTKKNPIFSIDSKAKTLIKSLHTRHGRVLFHGKKLHVKVNGNQLYIKGEHSPYHKVNSEQITLIPSSETLTINDKNYHGNVSLHLDAEKNNLLLINTIDIDNYIYSVLLSECYQSWPLEMQKLQAIVSRTYALHYLEQQKKQKQKRLYNVSRTTFHQRYNGTHEYAHLRQAVTETKNMILTYKDSIAVTMFDACCGGSIPANMKGLDFKKAPYLARKEPCHYCKKYSLYSWHREIPLMSFVNSLVIFPATSKLMRTLGSLRGIKITEKDRANIVHKLQLIGTQDSVTLRGHDVWHSMERALRSSNFSIKKVRNKIIIDGHGFGHQIGLCQRGARELVRRGWPYKKILSFYYPKTKLSRLNEVRTNAWSPLSVRPAVPCVASREACERNVAKSKGGSHAWT